MPRVKRGKPPRRHKKYLLAKDIGRQVQVYRVANQQSTESNYAYAHKIKREIRKLWIARINAALATMDNL